MFSNDILAELYEKNDILAGERIFGPEIRALARKATHQTQNLWICQNLLTEYHLLRHCLNMTSRMHEGKDKQIHLENAQCKRNYPLYYFWKIG